MKGYIEIVDVIGREVMDSRGTRPLRLRFTLRATPAHTWAALLFRPVLPPASSRLASCVTATSPATTARAYSRLLTL